jgi:tyrosine-specific transport protein
MENAISLPSSFSWSRFFNGSLMVFGTSVGAGMLGIPLMTAEGGFTSALSVTFLVWVFMAITGLLLLEVTFYMPKGANFITLSSQLLGKKGKWLTITFFLFLYYAFLVAYFSGGAPLLGEVLAFFNLPRSSILELGLFSSIFGGVILLGARVINKANFVLSLGMLAIFPVLIFLGAQGVSQEKLVNVKPFSISVAAVPVLFGAFGFHNIVPSLSNYLGRDKKVLRGSVLFGTFLAFFLYVVWQWLVLGSLSPKVLQEVLDKGLPVTYALAQGSSYRVFILGQVFAFAALTTSFLGVSFSLVDFIQDGIEQKRKGILPRFVYVLLALIPPLVCVLFNPHIFDRALGVAGGFGEALLNGILPILFFIKVKSLKKIDLSNKYKMFLGALLLFSVWAMFIEIFHLIQ